MDFTAGLLALGVGLAFDWQQLFPILGNRIAAICALSVGTAWLTDGQVGSWFDSTTTTLSSTAGAAGHDLTKDVPASAGDDVLGVIVAVAFLLWFLAAIPAIGAITKHVSGKAGSALTSSIIWAGVLVPPLIHLVPGNWGEFATWVITKLAEIGFTISGEWIL